MNSKSNHGYLNNTVTLAPSAWEQVKAFDRPITNLKMPTSKSGDFLKTLHTWGNLPAVLPIPDLTNLLATLCELDPKALLVVFEEAIWNQEIRFWSMASNGEWQQDQMRIFFEKKGKARIKPDTPTTPGTFRQGFEEKGRLHIEAMGINPADTLVLLEKRGCKIPDELRVLEQQTQPSPDTGPSVHNAIAPTEADYAALRARMEDKDAREAYVKALEKLSPEARSFGLDKAGLHNYSSAPPPIEPLGVRSIASSATLPPIDWNHWKLMPEVPLWQAVALSVNSNPETLRCDPAIVAWGKRTDIALSHVSVGNLDLVTRLEPILHSTVLLAVFAAWAVAHFTDLPPEFESMATASAGKSNDNTLAVVRPPTNARESVTVAAVSASPDDKPWLVEHPEDPKSKPVWYTPARYFARQLVKDDSTLLTKKRLLASKVVASLSIAGIKKRGGVKDFDPSTIMKAFNNVKLG